MQHEMTGRKSKVQTNGNRNIFVDLESFDRVRNHSPSYINDGIALQIKESVRWYADADEPTLTDKIERLDREWDVDRALMLLVATVAGGVLAFHAIFGWSAPAAVLRRLRFRTTKEIESERYALKTLRGDYNAGTKAA